MLTVFLDSTSINSVYDQKHSLVEDLLSRYTSLFKIFRTTCEIDKEKIKDIPSKPKIQKNEFNGIALDGIYQKLSFHPKNHCQEQFFFFLLKYARQTNNSNYIHESVYVSENAIFFEKFLRGGVKENCLRDFFQTLFY